MKKLLVFLLLCGVAMSAQAQWNAGSENHLQFLGKKHQEQAARLSQKMDSKVALSSLKIGKYTFELTTESETTENGIPVHYYFYRTKDGPAVFREAVEKNISTGKFALISDPVNRLVGPLQWKYVDYTLSQIKISVYQGNYLSSLKSKLRQQFGSNCVHQYRMQLTWPMDMLDVWASPTRAFYIDGTTVLIEASTSSKDLWSYPRACRASAPGVLFKKFMNGTEKFILKWKKSH